jgi:O-acetyl-ADP-ribose deacetylase (regulator of RNase III)
MKKIKFGNMVEGITHGILVHGCNAQGVMGGGIAKEIKAKWPENYEAYRILCSIIPQSEILGKVCTHTVKYADQCINQTSTEPLIMVANGITQLNYGRDGKKYVSYKAVQEVFDTAVALGFYHKMPVHYPLIGAGLGGGDWAIIAEIIDTCFAKHPEVPQILWHFE